MLEQLIPYIQSHEPVPHDLMLRCFREADSVPLADRRVPIANKILPGAGDYLPSWAVQQLISADLRVEEATELLNTRRNYIERATYLAPPILKLLGISDSELLYPCIINFDHACYDYPLYEKSKHEKINRKEMESEVKRILINIEKLIETLESKMFLIDIHYFHQKREFLKHYENHNLPLREFDQLVGELKHLHFAALETQFGDETGEQTIYVGGNKARTQIVEYAYQLALMCDRPKLVTTPGSDFSLLCTLLFEMASGVPDESLAGAINRFCRSSERRKLKKTEAEIRLNHSPDRLKDWEANNFHPVHQRISSLTSNIEFYEKMLGDRKWPDHIQNILRLKIKGLKKEVADQEAQHGPFLLETDEVIEAKLGSMNVELPSEDEHRLDMEIALGNARRAMAEREAQSS